MAATGLFDIARQGQNLSVRCRCGHSAVLEGKALERLFFLHRWDAAMPALGRRLRCGRCRQKSVTTAATSQPHTLVVGPADEAEWNALRRRLRD